MQIFGVNGNPLVENRGVRWVEASFRPLVCAAVSCPEESPLAAQSRKARGARADTRARGRPRRPSGRLRARGRPPGLCIAARERHRGCRAIARAPACRPLRARPPARRCFLVPALPACGCAGLPATGRAGAGGWRRQCRPPSRASARVFAQLRWLVQNINKKNKRPPSPRLPTWCGCTASRRSCTCCAACWRRSTSATPSSKRTSSRPSSSAGKKPPRAPTS